MSFFPYTVPAIVIGLIWARCTTLRPACSTRILTKIGLSGFENFAWLGDATYGDAGVDVRDHLELRRLLHGAVRRGHQRHPGGALRGRAHRRRRPVPYGHPDHASRSIRDTVQTAYIYLGILALDAFVYMQALNPNGGPDNTTRTMSQELFNTAFRKGQFGYATAMGVVLAVVTLLFAAIVFAVNRLAGGGERRAAPMTAVATEREPRHRDQQRTDGRRQGRRGHLARAPDRLVDHRHRPVPVGRAVVVQDDQGDPGLAVLAAGALELRQLRPCVDRRRHPPVLPEHGHRGGLSPSCSSCCWDRCAPTCSRGSRSPGRRFIYYLMLAGLTFPIFLAIVPLFFVLKNIGLLNTLPGLIIVYVAFALPFTVFFLYAFFKTLPDDVYEAALIDGAGEWRTFFQIMLPMARPGMASVAIFNFLGLWNQFLLPVALNTNPDRLRADPGHGRRSPRRPATRSTSARSSPPSSSRSCRC